MRVFSPNVGRNRYVVETLTKFLNLPQYFSIYGICSGDASNINWLELGLANSNHGYICRIYFIGTSVHSPGMNTRNNLLQN